MAVRTGHAHLQFNLLTFNHLRLKQKDLHEILHEGFGLKFDLQYREHADIAAR